MVVQITPIAVQNIGYKTYIIFAVLNFAFIVPIVFFFFPETANMRLEDIDYIFEKGGITGGVLSKGGNFEDHRADIERGRHGVQVLPDFKTMKDAESDKSDKSANFEHQEK